MKLDYTLDAGFGTRARLGIIVLETDESLEREFAQILALYGVVLYHTRIPMVPDVRSDTLARMVDDLPGAARLLPDGAALDVIGYGCTSAATVIGADTVAAAVQSVQPSARVTDPLTAIIAAGRALDVTRLGFVTPYRPDVSAQMRARLGEAGFQITAFGSFEEQDDRRVAKISAASIRDAAIRVAAAGPCEAVVIACTNLRCLSVIPEIERATGLPAISSNQALAWHMLRLAGVSDTRRAFGRLFAL